MTRSLEQFRNYIEGKARTIKKIEISFVDVGAGVAVILVLGFIALMIYYFPSFSMERKLKKEWEYYRDNCLSNLTLEDYRHTRFTIQVACDEEILKKYTVGK